MAKMETLKFTIIKNKEQYNEYCNILEELILNEQSQDEIDLLSLLIEKWDNDNNTLKDADPIELIKALLAEHRLKAKDLIEILNLSKGTISKVLNYQKGLSKETIRKLSDYFRVSQEAFNRPYKLESEHNRSLENARQMNKRQKIAEAG